LKTGCVTAEFLDRTQTRWTHTNPTGLLYLLLICFQDSLNLCLSCLVASQSFTLETVYSFLWFLTCSKMDFKNLTQISNTLQTSDIVVPDRKKANQFCGQEGSIAVHLAGDNEEPLIVVECNPQQQYLIKPTSTDNREG